jgi:hypothetical protein
MKIFLDTCIFLSYTFKIPGDAKKIIEDLKSDAKKEHIILSSVEQEVNYIYNRLMQDRLEIVKLIRIGDKGRFLGKLNELKKQKRGEIFSCLMNHYKYEDIFSNKRRLLNDFEFYRKKFFQDFYINTYNCKRYDDCLSKVSAEMTWIKTTFFEFNQQKHDMDTQHLAGAIHFQDGEKIFISEDWIFKLFETIDDYKTEINSHNLEVYSPENYISIKLGNS